MPIYFVVSRGGQGAISPPKRLEGGGGGAGGGGGLITLNIVVLLTFKVRESLKIGKGPLTMVMGHHIGPSGNTAYISRQQINKMTCAPSGDSDQPGHLLSLISFHCLQFNSFFIFQSHRNLRNPSYLATH